MFPLYFNCLSGQVYYAHDDAHSKAPVITSNRLDATIPRTEEQNAVGPDDVTAVTSEVPERFAKRRADALTTLAETTLANSPYLYGARSHIPTDDVGL